MTIEEAMQSYDQLVDEGRINIANTASAQWICKSSSAWQCQQVYLITPEEYSSQQESIDRMALDLATAHEQISQLKTIIYGLSKQLSSIKS